MTTTNDRRPPRRVAPSQPYDARMHSAVATVGEPCGLVAVYADRAAARGADLRPIIAAHRAAIDGVPNRAAPRGGERSFVAAPVLAVGRGTAVHRRAVRESTLGASSKVVTNHVPERRPGGILSLIDATLAQLSGRDVGRRQPVRRKAVARAAGTGLGESR